MARASGFRWCAWLGCFLLLSWLAMPASRGIILLSTADPDANTTAPSGDLANSGWSLEGWWGNFLGTPIAPHCFITAHHVGGAVGGTFSFNGIICTATAQFNDPSSDLTIWQVDGTFPAYAQLYTKTNEAGQPLVVFGRGTQRGVAVQMDGPAGPQLRGWRWGTPDGRQRWGENIVDSIANGDELVQESGGPSKALGDLLKVTFDSNGGPNEAHLSVGDSGGAVFIRDGSSWKLAGINYAVSGPYSLTNSGPGFDAALFDEGGFYTEDKTGWTLTPEQTTAQPGAFYATRISAHIEWIQSILLKPPQPVLQSALSPVGPYSDNPQASINPAAQTITVPAQQSEQFYRLRSSAQLRITSVRKSGASLIVSYVVPVAE